MSHYKVATVYEDVEETIHYEGTNYTDALLSWPTHVSKDAIVIMSDNNRTRIVRRSST